MIHLLKLLLKEYDSKNNSSKIDKYDRIVFLETRIRELLESEKHEMLPMFNWALAQIDDMTFPPNTGTHPEFINNCLEMDSVLQIFLAIADLYEEVLAERKNDEKYGYNKDLGDK